MRPHPPIIRSPRLPRTWRASYMPHVAEARFFLRQRCAAIDQTYRDQVARGSDDPIVLGEIIEPAIGCFSPLFNWLWQVQDALRIAQRPWLSSQPTKGR